MYVFLPQHSYASPPPQAPLPASLNQFLTMAPPPNTMFQKFLRYNFQASMVVCTGFGAWYMLKGPGRAQEEDIAVLVRRGKAEDGGAEKK
jgi:hypothetical protein